MSRTSEVVVSWAETDPGADAPDVSEADVDADTDTEVELAAPPEGCAPPALDPRALADLIGRVVERDEAALARLYEQTCGRVFGLVLRITRSQALAEEVVEDTYWQVWRQAPRFDRTRGSALAWLMAMARSRAIDALRSQARFEHDELDAEAHADSADPAGQAPQDLLDATRAGARLHQALAELDALPRQLVALAFFRNLTHEEIAAQTHLALGTVKSHIRRALLQLRHRLGDEPGGELSSVARIA